MEIRTALGRLVTWTFVALCSLTKSLCESEKVMH